MPTTGDSRSSLDQDRVLSTPSSSSHATGFESSNATYPPTSLDTPTAEDQAVALADVDRGWSAWGFVASAFVLDMFIWGGTFAYGTYLEYYLSHPPFNTGVSSVALSSVGTVALALNYAEMILGIYLCRRWPHYIRIGVWVCLIAYVAAMIAASFANEVWTLVLFQGVVTGSAGGLIYAPIYVWLSEWFVVKRSLAGGTIFAGAGLGGFVFPLVLNELLPRVGFRWTLRIFALITFVLCGIALFWLKPRIPIRKPAQQRGTTTREKAKAESKIEFRFLLDPTFVSMAAVVFVQGFVISPLLVYLPTYMASFTTPFNASLVLAFMNLASVPGQIVVGGLCDRYTYTRVMLASGCLSVLFVFALLRVGDTVGRVAGFAIAIGLTGGGFSSSWFPASLDIATYSPRPSPSQAAPLFGYLAIARGASAIVGPICAGLLYHPTTLRGEGFARYGLGDFVLFVGGMSAATVVGSLIVEGTRMLRPAKVVD